MATHPTTPTLIDWLSISGKSRGIRINKYKLVKLNFGTTIFKSIEELYHKNNRIATVTSQPHSKIIDDDLFIVKFDNWVLYSEDFYIYFDNIIKEVGLYDYKISRLDICKDFNRFNRGIKPNVLIKKFLSGEYLKLGKSKYNVWGETNIKLTYDYLAFGKKGSIINAYLYNKSNEMKQVKYKPHIANKWKQYKLKSSEDVFRLEFSVKKSELNFLIKESGECYDFNIDNIFIQADLEQLFLWLSSKHFRFKINTGQKNISRERNLILFERNEFSRIQWEIVKPIETDRADKIFLRKIDKLYSELRQEDVPLFEAIEKVRKTFIDRKHLKKFAISKLLPEAYQDTAHPEYFGSELKLESMLKEKD